MSRTAALALASIVALIGVVAALVFTTTREPAAPVSAPSDAGNVALIDAPAPAIAAPVPVAAPAVPARSIVTVDDADAELAKAIWVEGRVVLPEGTPLDEEAYVVSLGRKFEKRELHRARVGPDGRFRVPFPPRTKVFRLQLEAKYLYLEADERIEDDDLGASVVLEPRLGGHLEVALIPPDASTAAANELREAAIDVSLDRASTGRGSAPTGTLGDDLVWRFGGVPPSVSYDITLMPRTLARVFREDVRVGPGENERVELATAWGAIVRGHVVDERGVPVEGADVSCHAGDGRGWKSSRSTVTRADGSFELAGISAGSMTLQATRFGYLPTQVEPGRIAPGEELAGLSLVLRSGGILAGIVQWPDGRPAAGARVVLELEERSDPSEMRTLPQLWSSQTLAEDDGRFAFGGLPFGRYSVEVSADEAVPEAAATPTEPTGSKARRAKRPVGHEWSVRLSGVATGTDDLVLVLVRSLAISGRVVDDTSAPIERFSVSAVPVSEGDSEWRTFQDPDGRFRLDGLHAGAWRVSAQAVSEPRSTETIVTLPGDMADIALVVPRPASVSGVVVDPRGEPIRRARVRGQLATLGDRSTRSGRGAEDRTDSTGAFRVLGLAPGRTSIAAFGAAGYGASEAMVLELRPGEAREGLVLSLRLPGRLEIELASSIGVRAQREVRVRASHGADFSEAYVTDASGRIAIEGLDATSYSIVLVDRPGEDGVSSTSIWTGASVTSGETTRVVLGARVERAIRVSGRVKRSGSPVGDAVVWFSKVGSEDVQTSTDAEGEYALTLPRPGEYTAIVGGDGIGYGTQVTVPDAREFRFDFDVPAGRVSGRVIPPEGQPRGDVFVALVRVDAAASAGGTDFDRRFSEDDGTFEFSSVASGRYVVVAGGYLDLVDGVPSDDGVDRSLATVASAEFVVDGEQPVEGVEIKLREAGSILAIVRDSHGSPAAGASVELLTTGGHVVCPPWGREQWVTNTSGSVLLGAVATGTARVRARLGERASQVVEVAVSASATSEASLVLPD